MVPAVIAGNGRAAAKRHDRQVGPGDDPHSDTAEEGMADRSGAAGVHREDGGLEIIGGSVDRRGHILAPGPLGDVDIAVDGAGREGLAQFASPAAAHPFERLFELRCNLSGGVRAWVEDAHEREPGAGCRGKTGGVGQHAERTLGAVSGNEDLHAPISPRPACGCDGRTGPCAAAGRRFFTAAAPPGRRATQLRRH